MSDPGLNERQLSGFEAMSALHRLNHMPDKYYQS